MRQPPDSFPGDPRELEPARLGDRLDWLYRAALALCGSREDAEDLVQETFARVLRRPRVLRREQDLAYLLRALRNTFLAGRRPAAARRPPLPLEQAGGEAAPAPGADELAERRLVYAAIAELPPEFRDALVAVDVVGLSYREAARALRLPEGTVASRLARARAAVAERLRG